MTQGNYSRGRECKKALKLKAVLFILGLLLIGYNESATADQAYFDKFMTYNQWSQHLPTSPNSDFTAFIETTSPLTHKLREKWLYQLAQKKDWATYSQYYRNSTDINLQCYEQTALYQQGQYQQAIQGSAELWLHGGSQPKACDELFNLLLSHHEISNQLINQRVALALDAHNISLARYLLKQHNPPRLEDADLLATTHQNPTRISQFQPSKLRGEIYLYGLKLLVPRNMNLAIKLWENPRSVRILTEAQQHDFLSQIALYKAMRNQDDAPYWFAKVKPAYYSDKLLDWEIRFAIGHQNWKKLIDLIEHSKNKDMPCWQYWLARAYEALGDKEKSANLYQQVGTKRNYYGFLANVKLHKKLNFENEAVNHDPSALTVYKPITDQVKELYHNHQSWLASRLLNDFNSELPKREKSALAYWVAKELQWNGKSVYLSNNEELGNQLSLRFPLAYQSVIQNFSTRYHVPQPLIFAMIRQESTFFDDIVSSAGANGLMQVMPITAKVVAKRANIPYNNPKELFLSEKNINIGVAYLQQLAHQFRAHPVLIVAAYNAGPRQVNLWLKTHPPKEIDIWIETLPWQETRNYLKNVIAFYAVYQYRLGEKPNLDAFMQPFQ
ncbi:MAG: transglycosylase SLT domain-containing protein [Legionellaceae bacterium]|nr:transglycosylase SLT domain-containing protein [Legionellaceae bacterium]